MSGRTGSRQMARPGSNKSSRPGSNKSSRPGSNRSSKTRSRQSSIAGIRMSRNASEVDSTSGSRKHSKRKETSNSGRSSGNDESPNRKRLRRGCSFTGSYKQSGKKMMRERFLSDAQIEMQRKKKARQDKRSNGIKSKCESLLKFSEESDFKISATFLPSWDRGVPHCVLSKNWEKKDRPMKPTMKRKQYVKNWDSIQPFFDEEDDHYTSNASTSGETKKRGALIGSPNVVRPLALSKTKNKQLAPEIKCTICNATYEENTSKLWMFCGSAAGKRKCTKLAIHSECHFVVAKDQKDVDDLCRKYIRCFDCRKKEKEAAKKEREAQKKEQEETKKRRDEKRSQEGLRRGTPSDDDFY